MSAPAETPSILERSSIRAAVALIALAAFLLPLGWTGWTEPGESRYAEIAREMRESGDWITPRLNYVVYLLKPPLLYWLTATAQAIFGATEAAARLVPVTAGLAAVLCAALLAGEIAGSRAASLAALILATSPLFYALGLAVNFDMPLTGAVTAGLTAFWFGYRHTNRRRASYLLLYALAAVGVMMKGPVAVVIVGGSIALFLALRREWRELAAVFRLDGIAVAAAIVLPWFLLVSWEHPDFLQSFVVREHFERYTNWSEHSEPWWFYLPLFLGGMAPWTVLLALSAERRWPLLHSPGIQFCAVWAFWVVLFYSATRAKIANYLLPALPPLAVLSAAALLDWRARLPRALTVISWLLGGLGVGCLLTAPFFAAGIPNQRLGVLVPTLLAAAPVLLALAWVVLRLRRRERLDAALFALGAGLSLFLVIVMSGRVVLNHYEDLARELARVAKEDDRIVSYGQFVPGLAYYTQRRIVAAITWGDLDPQRLHGDDTEWFWPSDIDVLRNWEGTRRVFLVVNRADLERLRPLLRSPIVEIAAQGKKVAVSNRR